MAHYAGIILGIVCIQNNTGIIGKTLVLIGRGYSNLNTAHHPPWLSFGTSSKFCPDLVAVLNVMKEDNTVVDDLNLLKNEICNYLIL